MQIFHSVAQKKTLHSKPLQNHSITWVICKICVYFDTLSVNRKINSWFTALKMHIIE